MKKSISIFFVLFIGLVLAGFGLYVYRSMNGLPTANTLLPVNNSQTGAPSTGYGSMKSVSEASSANDLSSQLTETVDDEGASDLNALEKEINTL